MKRLLWIGGLWLVLAGCQRTPEPLADAATPTPVDTVAIAPEPWQPRYDYDTLRWLDIADLDTSIQVDMRYATPDNFMDTTMYPCGRCWLRPEVARALVAAHRKLQGVGLGIRVYDCYRPASVQQTLWNKYPDARYVTPPSRGSQHNRGLAVDLTLVDGSGQPLEMGTPYDSFEPAAHQTFTDFEDGRIVERRTLLRETMAAFGFGHIRTEWWHYSYRRAVQHRGLSDERWPCFE